MFNSERESKNQPKPWEVKPDNKLRNPNPARGIFANVDFDRLNKKPTKPTVNNSKPIINSIDQVERPETSTDTANRFISRALNNPEIQASTQSSKIRMSAADFFKDQSSELDSSFGPQLPKESPNISKQTLRDRWHSSSSSDDIEFVESKKASKSPKKSKKSPKSTKHSKSRLSSDQEDFVERKKLKKSHKKSKKSSKNSKHSKSPASSDDEDEDSDESKKERKSSKKSKKSSKKKHKHKHKTHKSHKSHKSKSKKKPLKRKSSKHKKQDKRSPSSSSSDSSSE